MSLSRKSWGKGSSRRFSARTLAVAGLLLLATLFTAPARAAGPDQLAAPEKIGVTLYQINGFKGQIPLKIVSKLVNGNEVKSLEFAHPNGMNENMQFMAKAVAPSGMIYKSFQISTVNGVASVTPASADQYDGKTIIDKVTLKPWQLSNVLQQCRTHMANGSGWKSEATFDLQVNSNVVHGKAVFALAANPNDPTKWTSRSATVSPKTRVRAYLVSSSRSEARPSRKPSRFSRPANQLNRRPTPQRIPQQIQPTRRPSVLKLAPSRRIERPQPSNHRLAPPSRQLRRR